MKTGNVKKRFLEGPKIRYKKSFEKFDHIFGKENVYFWKFDPNSFPDRCVVKDFCQRLHIDIEEDNIIRTNESLSLEATSLLYTYLRYGKALILNSVGEKRFPLLVKQISQLSGRKLRFSSELITPILEKNRVEIEWIEQRMGASLAEDIYKDDAIAIHSEKELITYTPETVLWLAKLLGEDYIDNMHPKMSHLEIAEWMHTLRLRLDQGQALVTTETTSIDTPVKSNSQKQELLKIENLTKKLMLANRWLIKQGQSETAKAAKTRLQPQLKALRRTLKKINTGHTE
ncbi:hypothetical protein [Methylocucumis oryzae]|uniref:Uncharacterized protein n=1 Tax=Methylocucumis oryzae TaxID=1632867 RepID=A0A0F3IIL2_9GAMM|nr:hypothetical protein [Methylocucumis oryzae]KJV05314.1 hypothetical protein VZ94_19110 [Methylocucumis oryzae]